MSSCPTCGFGCLLTSSAGAEHCGRCGTFIAPGGVVRAPLLVHLCRNYQTGMQPGPERNLWTALELPRAIGQPLKTQES